VPYSCYRFRYSNEAPQKRLSDAAKGTAIVQRPCGAGALIDKNHAQGALIGGVVALRVAISSAVQSTEKQTRGSKNPPQNSDHYR